MQEVLARALRALAIWNCVKDDAYKQTTMEGWVAFRGMLRGKHEGLVAEAHGQFLQAAYEVAFELVPRLLAVGEITTEHGVRYSATPVNGGFVLQTAPGDTSGMPLSSTSHIERMVHLMIDLPELLEALKAK